MNALLPLLVVAVVATAAHAYTTKYDNVDADEILNNERLYKKYFDCLAHNGKCTPDGKFLKETLPEALTTKCQKCTEKQKNMADKIIAHLLEKRPDDYDEVEKIYDPTGIYRKTLKA